MEKRRNCSWGAISPLFHNIFNIHFYLKESNTVICKNWLFKLFFLNTTNLICRSTDISNCFWGSLRFRDNESRLYLYFSRSSKYSHDSRRRRKNTCCIFLLLLLGAILIAIGIGIMVYYLLKSDGNFSNNDNAFHLKHGIKSLENNHLFEKFRSYCWKNFSLKRHWKIDEAWHTLSAMLLYQRRRSNYVVILYSNWRHRAAILPKDSAQYLVIP